MSIDIEKIKILRQTTQAGIMDCQTALIHSKGDINQAVIFLRKKGIMKVANRQQTASYEGLTNVITENNQAVLYELNSETDFVAKNKFFINLLDSLGQIFLKKVHAGMNIEEILNLEYEKQTTVRDLLLGATAILQETICLSRVIKVVKQYHETFGFYRHHNGSISVLVVMKNDLNNISKDIAMHIAAYKPQFLDKQQIDSQILEQEKNIIYEQINKELDFNKSTHIKNQIIEGRLRKFIDNVCLLEQPFIKDSSQKIKDYLKIHHVQIVNYWFLKLGDNINK